MRYALERLRGDVTVLQQRVSTPNSADLAPGNPAAPPGSPKPVPDSLLAVFSSFSCSFRYCFLSGWDRHFASFFFCFSSVFLLFFFCLLLLTTAFVRFSMRQKKKQGKAGSGGVSTVLNVNVKRFFNRK